mgnify:FL=1
MKKIRAYRATPVKNICLDPVLADREGQEVHVGLDVGKEHLFVVLRWGESDFERPWKVKNPFEIRNLMELLVELNRGRRMTVALEPTGTYGDAARQAFSDAGLRVHRVSPKAAHDYAEIFDGVPSKHDGKDAAIVAELTAFGKSSGWPFEVSVFDEELAYFIDGLETQRRMLTMWYGRLEGQLARHWPEATNTLRLTSGVLLRSLATYGGPGGLAAEETALEQLVKWGRSRLSQEKGEKLLADARDSVGVRQSAINVRRLQEYASEALACRRAVSVITKQLQELTAKHPVIQAQALAVGLVTASVLWVYLGDPRNYDSGFAYQKAMGLNLKVRSSGKYKGRLKITKRGHSQVRRWLYFAALRMIQQDGVKQWYEAKKAKNPAERHEAKRGLIGVMRKRALALYQVGACDKQFEVSLLFPGSVGSSQTKAA